jgi:D-alanyl-D-alanine carboxypeptidase
MWKATLCVSALVSTLAVTPAPTQLQRDVDALAATGITGVLARSENGHHTEVARAGVADLTSRRKPTAQMWTRIGSTTKTYVATLVLQLVAEHRLSLDDPIGRWLPGVVQGNGNDGRRITVRQILQHTSGLYDYTTDLIPLIDTPAKLAQNKNRVLTSAQRGAMAMRHAPDFAPGAKWEYSNTNYVLAGMLVQAVTGRSWQHELRSRILRPLGLTHTITPDVSTTLPAPHPTLYQQFVPKGSWTDTTDVPLLDADADGSIMTSQADLLAFYRALLGGRLLPATELAEMRKTVPSSDGRYGLGLEWHTLSCGGGYWFHGGNGLGYTDYNGTTDEGARSVVVSVFSRSAENLTSTQQDTAALHVVDDALC